MWGGWTHGEQRWSTQTGAKARHEGPCLPLLETNILPRLCRQRLGPPRKISPGGYYRPEDEMIFRRSGFHTHTRTQRDAGGRCLILWKMCFEDGSLFKTVTVNRV